jgi:sulfur carrier protein
MMTVTINGKTQEIGEGTSLAAYLQTGGIDPSHVVAEVNGAIVKKERFAERYLKAGDIVEVIRFVGGG